MPAQIFSLNRLFAKMMFHSLGLKQVNGDDDIVKHFIDVTGIAILSDHKVKGLYKAHRRQATVQKNHDMGGMFPPAKMANDVGIAGQ